MNGLKEMDRQNLLLARHKGQGNSVDTEIWDRWCLSNVKKFSFPKREVEVWNVLREDVTAEGVKQLEDRLNNYSRGQGTTGHTEGR